MTLALAPISATSLLKVGGSLLGGLLGRKKKGPSWEQQVAQKQQLEEQRFTWLRKGAEAAGFNPLSVLNATGGGMAVNPQAISPLSTRAIVGDAIKELAGSLADPMDVERDQLEIDLAKEQLELSREQRARLANVSLNGTSPYRTSGSPNKATQRMSPDVQATIVQMDGVPEPRPGLFEFQLPSPIQSVDRGLPDPLDLDQSIRIDGQPIEGESEIWGVIRRGELLPFIGKLLSQNLAPSKYMEYADRLYGLQEKGRLSAEMYRKAMAQLRPAMERHRNRQQLPYSGPFQ